MSPPHRLFPQGTQEADDLDHQYQGEGHRTEDGHGDRDLDATREQDRQGEQGDRGPPGELEAGLGVQRAHSEVIMLMTKVPESALVTKKMNTRNKAMKPSRVPKGM